jgi:hypothetical protein
LYWNNGHVSYNDLFTDTQLFATYSHVWKVTPKRYMLIVDHMLDPTGDNNSKWKILFAEFILNASKQRNNLAQVLRSGVWADCARTKPFSQILI